MVLDSFFNAVFGPLLQYPPIVIVIVVTLVMLILITLIQKFTSNQTEMKTLKERQKQLQKEIKESKNDTKKMMELQKQMMEINMKYFRHSFRPMLFTFLPIIIIFGWMNSMLMYEQIMPNQEFNFTAIFQEGVSGNADLISYDGLELVSTGSKQDISRHGKENSAQWILKGPQGAYVIEIEHKGNKYSKDLTISEKKIPIKEPMKVFKGQDLKALRVDYKKLIALNLLGWKLGWLGTYIILSLILSGIIRKIFKVH